MRTERDSASSATLAHTWVGAATKRSLWSKSSTCPRSPRPTRCEGARSGAGPDPSPLPCDDTAARGTPKARQPRRFPIGGEPRPLPSVFARVRTLGSPAAKPLFFAYADRFACSLASSIGSCFHSAIRPCSGGSPSGLAWPVAILLPGRAAAATCSRPTKTTLLAQQRPNCPGFVHSVGLPHDPPLILGFNCRRVALSATRSAPAIGASRATPVALRAPSVPRDSSRSFSSLITNTGYLPSRPAL